ncbi:hypothetical protein NE865_04640 [Phthorimaea operculella]|nr:hypothetical protein NE865_04640 [Phthorimaea operculella]
MSEETDFNDVLDNIFLREESQHKQSYEEGYKAGSLAGNPEGYHLGYHRGAELGRELGYYYGTVLEYLKANNTTESKHPEKLLNQLTKVKDLLEAFPRDNCVNPDILSMAENVRAQYKKACAMLKVSSANPYEAVHCAPYCGQDGVPPGGIRVNTPRDDTPAPDALKVIIFAYCLALAERAIRPGVRFAA